jgi:hypothetical protein
MTKPRDPKRLVEERGTPARLSEAIRLARRGPDPESVSRISGALGLVPPLMPPPVPPPSGLVVATGGGSALGVGIAAVVVTGLGAGTFFFAQPAPSPKAPVASRVAAVASVKTAPSPSPEMPALVAAESARAATPAPSVRRRKVEPDLSTPELAPSAVETPAPVSPPDAASRLREEAQLVRSAERLLASDPSRALALTEERRRRFPGGALDQEADVVAIEALLKLGRRDAAAARASRFEASHPGSVHARRLRALIGSKP